MAERIKSSGAGHPPALGRTSPPNSDRKLARGAHYDPVGYSYYLRGSVDVVRTR